MPGKRGNVLAEAQVRGCFLAPLAKFPTVFTGRVPGNIWYSIPQVCQVEIRDDFARDYFDLRAAAAVTVLHAAGQLLRVAVATCIY